jgi:[ribosomal protein S18]-alanine N-acetyltransferase
VSSAKLKADSILEDVVIARMSEHDLLEVVEIEELSGLSRWGWAAYYSELQRPNRDLMLVALQESLPRGRIVGYIVARESAGELHINNVAVRDEYRRRGIGAVLLNRILEEGKGLGLTAAFLEVRAGNFAARTLYERCGFSVIARRPNYYSEPVEDALVMSFVL